MKGIVGIGTIVVPVVVVVEVGITTAGINIMTKKEDIDIHNPIIESHSIITITTGDHFNCSSS